MKERCHSTVSLAQTKVKVKLYRLYRLDRAVFITSGSQLYFAAGNSPNLGLSYYLKAIAGPGFSDLRRGCFSVETCAKMKEFGPISRGTPWIHQCLKVIGTGATHIPAGLAHSNLFSQHRRVPFLHLGAVRL